MSLDNNKPYLIEFPSIGASDIGYISVSESQKNIPFELKRVYWTYHTPENIVRGRHAHHHTQQILIAAMGRIVVNLESPDSTEIITFVLDKPNVGVYIPAHYWHTMQYSHIAVQLVLASAPYDEADYIRDYQEFKQLNL